LLADGAHGHRTVRLNGASEISLHELAGEMESSRTYHFNPGLRHCGLMNPRERSQGDEEHDKDYSEGRPTTLHERRQLGGARLA
jgi:hypothetical protein